MSYINTLHLTRDPFTDYVDGESFFPYAALTETVVRVRHLMDADHHVILIAGDPGSGKTLMIKQILAMDEDKWRVCSLQPTSECAPLRAYTMAEEALPVVMLDDGNLLEPETLSALVKMTLGDSPSLKQIILTGLPHTALVLDALRHLMPHRDGIQEVPLPPMELDEVKSYLEGRLRSAGYEGECPFSLSQIMRIHTHSGGFPGAANAEAAKELAQAYAGESEPPPSKKGFLSRFFGR